MGVDLEQFKKALVTPSAVGLHRRRGPHPQTQDTAQRGDPGAHVLKARRQWQAHNTAIDPTALAKPAAASPGAISVFPVKELLGAEEVLARLWHEHTKSKMYKALTLGEILCRRTWAAGGEDPLQQSDPVSLGVFLPQDLVWEDRPVWALRSQRPKTGKVAGHAAGVAERAHGKEGLAPLGGLAQRDLQGDLFYRDRNVAHLCRGGLDLAEHEPGDHHQCVRPVGPEVPVPRRRWRPRPLMAAKTVDPPRQLPEQIGTSSCKAVSWRLEAPTLRKASADTGQGGTPQSPQMVTRDSTISRLRGTSARAGGEPAGAGAAFMSAAHREVWVCRPGRRPLLAKGPADARAAREASRAHKLRKGAAISQAVRARSP